MELRFNMAIKIKSKTSGEVIAISGIRAEGEVILSKPGRSLGQRFFDKYPMLSRARDNEDGRTELALNNNWELVVGRTAKDGQPKQAKPRAKKPEPKTEPVPQPEQKSEPEPQPTQPEPQPVQPKEEPEDDGAKLVAYIKALKGGSVDAEQVRKICSDVFAEYASSEPKKAKLVAKKAKASGSEEVYCEDFDDIVQDIADGFHVYLYGPAGSGKSHTAEQVAERLGLDFYGQTTIQFAHDVRGYGDASGQYQATPFYKAFKFGGLYFQDEYDRSNAEAAIVLNSALANGWYDFPIEGRVEAHPNFRFIAAGNTKMTGPDEEYVTGQEMDASSRDRFATMYKVDYLHKVELHIANGDLEWVSFVEDLRHAIKAAGIQHIASYRATKYAAARKGCDKKKILSRSTLKGLESDEIRLIYGQLADTTSVWAKEMKKLF